VSGAHIVDELHPKLELEEEMRTVRESKQEKVRKGSSATVRSDI